MNKALLFQDSIKMAHEPIDLDAAAITGARIHAGVGERIAVVIVLASSVGAGTIQATLRQHNAAAAGTSKDLSVANNYYLKKAAETSFTKTTPTAAAALYDVGAAVGADKAILVLEVLPEQLDVANDFAWVSVDLADSAMAKIVSTFYVVQDAKLKPAYLEVL